MSDLQALLRFQILDERNATELAQRMLMRAAADHISELESDLAEAKGMIETLDRSNDRLRLRLDAQKRTL